MDTAYVLHRWPYQESSLMCDLLTRQEGRVRVIAKGARRPKSPWRSLLQPFIALQVDYRGRSELQTLTHAEAEPTALSARQKPALQSTQLYSAFYMNELIQRLTSLHQPLEQLFEEYAQGLALLTDALAVEPILRRFEWQLLSHLGLAFDWHTDCLTGAELPNSGLLLFQPGAGFRVQDAHAGQGPNAATERCYAAADIAELADLDVQTERQLKLLKRLMRQALAPYLGDQPLRSRELFSQQIQSD